MKVEKRDNTVSLLFKDVEKGQCFEYDGNSYYLKTHPFKAADDYYYNAVTLETGDHCRFDDNDEVTIYKNARVVFE